jgi:CheY-like chemotaxis protein
VIEANDYARLIERSLAHNPDCLIVDWELPGLEGGSRLTALRDLLPISKSSSPAPGLKQRKPPPPRRRMLSSAKPIRLPRF